MKPNFTNLDDVDEDKLIEKMAPQLRGATYYWIVGDYQGRMIVLGAKTSEAEAEEFAFQKMEGATYEIVPLPTKDKSRAIQMLKARRLDKTGSIDTALKRAKRKI